MSSLLIHVSNGRPLILTGNWLSPLSSIFIDVSSENWSPHLYSPPRRWPLQPRAPWLCPHPEGSMTVQSALNSFTFPLKTGP